MKGREAEIGGGQVAAGCVFFVRACLGSPLGHTVRQTRGVLCDKYSYVINERPPLTIN